MRLSSGSSSSSSRPRALLLLCPLLLTVIFVASKTCDARNLRSVRLSTAAAASLGMPLPAADAKSTKPAPTLLFTLQSDAAFLQLGEAGDPDPDLGKLTLEGVAPTAVWFSERPDRRAGVLPTATLASAALDIVATDDDEERIDAHSSDEEEGPPRRAATWLGVPNVALTGTSERGDTATAVLTVLGRPSYDEKARTMTADVRVVPMRSLPTSQPEEGEGADHLVVAATTAAAVTTTAAATVVPSHSPPSTFSSPSPSPPSPRSLSLSRAALLIDQMPISDGYVGNQYGFANDCLSSMSPSCNPFSGTGFYRPGFVGWLGGQMGPGNTPQYPPGTSQQQRQQGRFSPQQPGTQSPSPPPPPPPAVSSSSGTNSGGQAYLMSQPYDPSKGR